MIRTRMATPDDASGIADVHIKCWNSTYRGIVADDFIGHLSHSRSEQRWSTILSDKQASSLVTIALNDAGEVVGFAAGGRERDEDPNFDSELYAIYILQQYQGQGIGRELVSNIARGLLSKSFNSMLVWALEENHPARKFYMSLGGQEYCQRTFEIGGVGYPDVAYRWVDFRSLLI